MWKAKTASASTGQKRHCCVLMPPPPCDLAWDRESLRVTMTAAVSLYTSSGSQQNHYFPPSPPPRGYNLRFPPLEGFNDEQALMGTDQRIEDASKDIAVYLACEFLH